MAGEIGTVEIGRRRIDCAVDLRGQLGAIAGEGAAQVGDHGVALPVGDREEFRRDDIERRAARILQARRIAVVAAGDLDRGFDQDAAGIVADRAERIVVDPQPLARRLADHGAGHRRRDRRLVGGLRRRHREAELSADRELRRCGRRRAGARRRLRPRLCGIVFRLLAGAVERVVTGCGGAGGRRQAIGRDLADPRRRLGVRWPGFSGPGSRFAIGLACIGRRPVVERRRRGATQAGCLRREEAVARWLEQLGGQALGVRRRQRSAQDEQGNTGGKTGQGGAKEMRTPAAAAVWPQSHDENTSAQSNTSSIGSRCVRKTSLMELKQLWLMSRCDRR